MRGTMSREQTSTVARGGGAGVEEVGGMEEGASAGAGHWRPMVVCSLGHDTVVGLAHSGRRLKRRCSWPLVTKYGRKRKEKKKVRKSVLWAFRPFLLQGEVFFAKRFKK